MARLRARGPYWELVWSGPDIDPETGKKRRHSRNLGRRDELRKRDAELALDGLRRELFLDEHRLRAPSSPSLQAWVNEYVAWHSVQFPHSHYRTRQVLEQHVLPGWEFKRLDEITDRDVEDKMAGWRGLGLKDHTLTKHLRVTKALFNRAVEKRLLAVSPAETVASPKILNSAPHVFYEQDELETLYTASCMDDDPRHKESLCAPWHAPAWKLLANTGMRRGEGLLLKREWVKRGVVQVLSTDEERTKSGKWREIPLFPGAQEALEALDETLGDREYVLPQIAPPSLSRAAARCILKADLDGSIHTLRHTFISHLAMDPRVPIRDIQLWAGHASIATTEKYMYLRRGDAPVALSL